MTNYVNLSLNYPAYGHSYVKLPEGISWEDVVDWGVKNDSLYYRVRGEDEDRELYLDGFDVDTDGKRPEGVDVYASNEEGDYGEYLGYYENTYYKRGFSMCWMIKTSLDIEDVRTAREYNLWLSNSCIRPVVGALVFRIHGEMDKDEARPVMDAVDGNVLKLTELVTRVVSRALPAFAENDQSFDLEDAKRRVSDAYSKYKPDLVGYFCDQVIEEVAPGLLA